MPQMRFTFTVEDYDHPRADELAGMPLESWPADAVQTAHVVAEWEGVEDMDDYGVDVVGLKIAVQTSDGREWIGTPPIRELVLDRIYAILEDAARMRLQLRKREADRERIAREVEQAHMQQVHADGSECPDGCGGL